VISWGGVLLVIGGLGGVPGTAEDFQALLLPVVVAMLAGPSISGVFCTWFFHGRAGLSGFLSRLLRWRVDARWYAFALLTAPLVVAMMLLLLSRLSPVYLPGILTTSTPWSHLALGVVTGLAAGFLKSLGGPDSQRRSCAAATVRGSLRQPIGNSADPRCVAVRRGRKQAHRGFWIGMRPPDQRLTS
jgi:hypothetical protein